MGSCTRFTFWCKNSFFQETLLPASQNKQIEAVLVKKIKTKIEYTKKIAYKIKIPGIKP